MTDLDLNFTTYSYERVYESNCVMGDVEARPIPIILSKGVYKIELWGASGGALRDDCAGRGGYTRAIINVKDYININLYIGSRGNSSNKVPGVGGCNGGGNGSLGSVTNPVISGGGGGATDIRVGVDLESRILVAGGGGGRGGTSSCGSDNKGGDGGGVNGFNGSGWGETYGKGATNEHGGIAGQLNLHTIAENGTFGRGGNGIGQGISSGGGGGGYYGGGGSYETGGGGGSGYISPELNGITLGGNMNFPSPYSGYETGHIGNGAIKITLMSSNNILSCGHGKQMKINNYLSHVFV